MPTPESASFKAAKPTVPPSFDGVNYDDNKQLKAAQDAVIREQWVQSMMARLIREEMGKCYYREGVNHLEKCGHLRERYLQQLQHSKIKGYMFEQQNYISENKGRKHGSRLIERRMSTTDRQALEQLSAHGCHFETPRDRLAGYQGSNQTGSGIHLAVGIKKAAVHDWKAEYAPSPYGGNLNVRYSKA
nr:nadh-ubiquinone oxidoreductase 12 kda subunit, mitochondrial [Quercus suber]